jgi:hypothetical protein
MAEGTLAGKAWLCSLPDPVLPPFSVTHVPVSARRELMVLRKLLLFSFLGSRAEE